MSWFLSGDYYLTVVLTEILSYKYYIIHRDWKSTGILVKIMHTEFIMKTVVVDRGTLERIQNATVPGQMIVHDWRPAGKRVEIDIEDEVYDALTSLGVDFDEAVRMILDPGKKVRVV